MTPEAKVLASLIRELKRRGVWHLKTHGGPLQRAGIPDLILIDRGRTLWIEVKAAGEKPSRLQQHTLKQIQEHGGEAFVVDKVEELIAILERRNADETAG